MAKVNASVYADSNTGAALADLTAAFGVKWQDVPNGQGSFRLELPIGHAQVAQCTYGRVVRLGHSGVQVFSGVIGDVSPTPVDEQTEGVESVTVSGDGLGVELDEAKTLPKPAGKSPGTIADIFPPIDERPMEWYGMDFDRSSGWVSATKRGDHGESGAVYPGLPGGMRVLGADWIWSADVTGPEDDFLFFYEWVYLTAGFKVLDFACYDAAVYINGRRHPRNCAYGEKERVEFTVINAGYVLICAEADLRDTNFDEGFIAQITEGEEGALEWATSTSMKVYGTPDASLSMTATQALLALKADHDALDDWTFDFTASADTDSNSLTGTRGISARIGDDSLWDIVQALSEVYIDFDMAGTGKTLSIWEKDSHANTPTLPLVAGGTSAAATEFVNIKELSWDGKRAPFNALLVRYGSGWFHRPASLPAKPRWGSLSIEHVESGATAIEFADATLSALGVDQETATIGLVQNLPDEQLPYVGFDKWSQLAVPSKDNLDATTLLPVKALTCEGDRDGDLVATVELGSLVEDRATRVERWIARSTRGGLAGLVQMAQGLTQTLQQRPPGLNQTEVVLFDFINGGDDTTATRTMPGKGLVHKLIARVDDAAGGTSSMDVTVGGVSVTLTGTTAAGFQLLDFDEGLAIPYDPRTLATIDITTVGHRKITVYAAVSETR